MEKPAAVCLSIFYVLCGCVMGSTAFSGKALDNILTGFGFFHEPFLLVDIAILAMVVVHLAGAYQVFCQHIFVFFERSLGVAAGWSDSDFNREVRVGPFQFELIPYACFSTDDSKVTQSATSLSFHRSMPRRRSWLSRVVEKAMDRWCPVWRLVHLVHSRLSSTMQTGRASDAALAGDDDGSLPPERLDWFRIMGPAVLNTDASCVISASVMCMEALCRRVNENYHGAYSFFLKVRVDAVQSLKNMCMEKGVWYPYVGATVPGVLAVIRSLEQGLQTEVASISLRLQSFKSFHVSELSPLKVTSMLDKIGPMVGVLPIDNNFFSSSLYRRSTTFVGNHAVVCTGHRYIDGELFIIVQDNVEWYGPFRVVRYEAFKEFHVLTVEEC